jgi:hypothetical protein
LFRLPSEDAVISRSVSRSAPGIVICILSTFVYAQAQPSLAETFDWIKSKIDGEDIDTGIHVSRIFQANGCRVSLQKFGGAVPLGSGQFNLEDIAYVDVEDRPVGSLWTGTFLVFRTSNGAAKITRGDLVFREGRLAERPSTSFDWHLGSVRAGSPTTELRELGGRLRTAFAHAVKLCGGSMKAEPF